jgi:hypothetical protein
VEREEQLARMVHAVAAFGGDVDYVMRTSGYSAAVVSRAMSYIELDGDDYGPVSWSEVLGVLNEALGRLRNA